MSEAAGPRVRTPADAVDLVREVFADVVPRSFVLLGGPAGGWESLAAVGWQGVAVGHGDDEPTGSDVPGVHHVPGPPVPAVLRDLVGLLGGPPTIVVVAHDPARPRPRGWQDLGATGVVLRSDDPAGAGGVEGDVLLRCADGWTVGVPVARARRLVGLLPQGDDDVPVLAGAARRGFADAAVRWAGDAQRAWRRELAVSHRLRERLVALDPDALSTGEDDAPVPRGPVARGLPAVVPEALVDAARAVGAEDAGDPVAALVARLDDEADGSSAWWAAATAARGAVPRAADLEALADRRAGTGLRSAVLGLAGGTPGGTDDPGTGVVRARSLPGADLLLVADPTTGDGSALLAARLAPRWRERGGVAVVLDAAHRVLRVLGGAAGPAAAAVGDGRADQDVDDDPHDPGPEDGAAVLPGGGRVVVLGAAAAAAPDVPAALAAAGTEVLWAYPETLAPTGPEDDVADARARGARHARRLVLPGGTHGRQEAAVLTARAGRGGAAEVVHVALPAQVVEPAPTAADVLAARALRSAPLRPAVLVRSSPGADPTVLVAVLAALEVVAAGHGPLDVLVAGDAPGPRAAARIDRLAAGGTRVTATGPLPPGVDAALAHEVALVVVLPGALAAVPELLAAAAGRPCVRVDVDELGPSALADRCAAALRDGARTSTHGGDGAPDERPDDGRDDGWDGFADRLRDALLAGGRRG
ncbi:hypothetical protein [Cellulomonas marina]|uniref:Uncharacterized protein n=1 Tax=Cellulomonas marina TaxID=988821 RepID=A0A1I0UYK8_9CELL|nr:hypothetical protein [Cellulomonas marina]GIG29915.1 hypothetical protein Cma02nite_25150 [Cellulomonas marina]SFA69179.1 hypothetical protein SAMN05421867_10122 [Cellulomonas marina]